MPFWDVLVERCTFSFITSVYRKPKFTGLYLNWHSFAPKSRKLNQIRCLSYRALNICSDCNIENELKVINDIFIDNGYPEEVIDVNIRHAVTRLKKNEQSLRSSEVSCILYTSLGGFCYIYISMNRPSLCRQLNNHIWNIFGELLKTGWLNVFFFSPRPCNPNYIIYTLVYIRFPEYKTWKAPDKRALVHFTIS